MSDHRDELIATLKNRVQWLELALALTKVVWRPITDDDPVPGERYLVSVATDDGDEVHILLRENYGWIHEGEYTFEHGYFFRPIMWAHAPKAPKRGVERD